MGAVNRRFMVLFEYKQENKMSLRGFEPRSVGISPRLFLVSLSCAKLTVLLKPTEIKDFLGFENFEVFKTFPKSLSEADCTIQTMLQALVYFYLILLLLIIFLLIFKINI